MTLSKDNMHSKSMRSSALYPKPRFVETTMKNESIEAPDHYGEGFNLNQINRGKVAIFVDGANLFYAALQLGLEIDYSKLLCRLTGGGRLLRAFFYTGCDRNNEKQQGFLLWMRRNGYRVVTKELIQHLDGSKKANLDVEIAVDMLTLAGHYDTAVLVSGDGDLAYAVQAVSYRGARVEVVSLKAMTSDALINVADCYVDLDTVKSEIQKDHSQPNYIYRPLSTTGF
jgi:uncharacterized LabA/DUF88 family protein